ncbi:carboxypeptidase-like regulatory domain-containing protein [Aureispira anguillae]|uniref:Carboxypeptidase-like regulatory domain-containing protein n=1 Tax=Aureispira anguillae TaxID=2864201 RepID=A0A915YHR6_9BACT|nr:carboxypeptidase-like regulatory domain-containing protein [Aureispira anguillae]BDS13237.1 carboxypeptidase-like regulatory domain-containing protein [Aureispira anguillae]
MFISILISCCLLVGIIPCTGQSSFITGKVFSEVNKSTLYNAKLVLKRNHKYYRKTKTDHVGNYWFGNLPAGSYSIWVIQEGYCQLEMTKIVIATTASIQLDLGLMEQSQNTNLNLGDKVYKVYRAPIQVDLAEHKTTYQNFRNEIQIIKDVYNGPEIRIAPPKSPSSPIENNRATHHYESLKALEKTSAFVPR